MKIAQSPYADHIARLDVLDDLYALLLETARMEGIEPSE